jgi:hypothetical protein
LTCAETQALKDTKPLYFMATSLEEKEKWLLGIQYFRKQWEKERNQGDGDASQLIKIALSQAGNSNS